MRSERSGPRRPAQDACEVSPVRQLQALLRQNFGAFAERCFYEALALADLPAQLASGGSRLPTR